jgi:hypothetical protein
VQSGWHGGLIPEIAAYQSNTRIGDNVPRNRGNTTSSVIGRFSAVDILRLFLHGIFAIYPIAFFPEITNSIGPTGIVVFAIVAGLILHAVPLDASIPNYRKYYIEELNDHVLSVIGREIDNVRYVYDVFFYEILTPVVRYRVHFQVSLYYFYSRTWFVSLIHAIIFTAASFYLVVPPPSSNAVTIVPGETAGVLLEKSILLVILSYSVALVAFRQSSGVIKHVSLFEKALVDYHQNDIRGIAKESGYLGLKGEHSNNEKDISPASKA